MKYLSAIDGLFPDRPSGSARVAWDQSRAVRDAGHDVAMVCMNRSSDRPSGLDEVEGIRVVRYDQPRTHRLSPRRYSATVAAASQAVRRHLADERWDTVHLHTPLTAAGVMEAIQAPGRVVYTLHSPSEVEMALVWSQQGLAGLAKRLLGMGPIRKLERRLLERSDAIHTLSEFTRGEVDRLHGFGEKATVIPHWRRDGETRSMSKEAAREKLGWPSDAPILFTLRRHVHRMGLDTAIEAIAPLASEGRCVFVAAGDGPYRATFEQRARDLGADALQVRFPGRISDEELALSYQAADLFVLPTRALEGFGLIVVEAMSYGLPVLGTKVGAIPELIRPIAPKLIVPPGDADALGDRVGRWLDGKLVVPTSEAMAEYVDKRFDRAVVVPRQLDLFGLGA
jgi:glycosyltransferase involved in cell wall biosynthesis